MRQDKTLTAESAWAEAGDHVPAARLAHVRHHPDEMLLCEAFALLRHLDDPCAECWARLRGLEPHDAEVAADVDVPGIALQRLTQPAHRHRRLKPRHRRALIEAEHRRLGFSYVLVEELLTMAAIDPDRAQVQALLATTLGLLTATAEPYGGPEMSNLMARCLCHGAEALSVRGAG